MLPFAMFALLMMLDQSGAYYSTTSIMPSSSSSYGCADLSCHNGGSCYMSYNYPYCFCQYGFSGKNCQYKMDMTSSEPYSSIGYESATSSACSNNPCRNGGTCNINPYTNRGYYCECPYGYSGTNCEAYASAMCEDYSCDNGGSCRSSVQTINSYFRSSYEYCSYQYTSALTDYSSSLRIEPSACGLSSCTAGETCQTKWYSTATRIYRPAEYCSCRYPYSGRYCNYNPYGYETTTTAGCSSNPCRNGGTCSNNNWYSGGYYCSCPYSYSGRNCEAYIGYETTSSYGCSNRPCRNGGSCYDSKYYSRGYYCNCLYPYSGTNCESYIGYRTTTSAGCSSSPCRNGGTCYNDYYYNRDYVCYCPQWYSGTNCESYIGYETTKSYGCSNRPCKNGGSCYDSNYYSRGYYCYCFYPYSGTNCESYIGYETTTYSGCSSNPCRNGGTCYNSYYYDKGYYCSCPHPYSGMNCESGSTLTSVIEDEINVSCSNNYFSLSINRSRLSKYAREYYIALQNGKVYFGSCKLYYYSSYYMSDTITRSYSLTACGTTRQNDYNEIVFTNRLHIVENVSNVVTRERLGLLIQCRLNKDLSVKSAFHVRNASSMISVSGNFSAYMRFSRKEYSGYIYSYPASVNLDEELFAHITLYSMHSLSLRPVIEECLARPDNSSRSKEEYYLIKNRCVVDPTTRILGDNETAEFAFKTFDFIRETGPVYIECKIHVCTTDDLSYRCSRGCSTYRKKRELEEEEKPITLSEGPFVQETENEDTSATLAATVGGAVAGVVGVAFVAAVVVKVKPLLMATAKVAPAAAGYQPVPVSI